MQQRRWTRAWSSLGVRVQTGAIAMMSGCLAAQPSEIADELAGALAELRMRAADAAEEVDPRMVIFGGEGADGCYRNDVWQLSLLNRTWVELSANVPCQKRCAASLRRMAR